MQSLISDKMFTSLPFLVEIVNEIFVHFFVILLFKKSKILLIMTDL